MPHHKHQTHRLREAIYLRCQDTTISSISRQMRMSYKTVERIYYDIAGKKLSDTPPSSVVGIDEIAVRKGHRYETVITDILTGKVHRMGANRDTEAARSLLETLDARPVKTFVMDMWQPFYHAVTQLFPDVSIVIDKYHVVQKINHALDSVRKTCQPSLKGVKKGRFSLLKRRFRLSEKQMNQLEAFHEASDELAYAYYLKEWFYDLYQQSSYEEAKAFLDTWIAEAEKSPFASFHEVVKTLKHWQAHILEYFRAPYTNARTEARTNHKIKNRKRMAYGYRNLDHFRIRVQLDCAGSVPSSPQDRLADSA
ncbi:ISL3 family transposase [Terrilactibacillus sp. S3-3]|nr:ISL3 family transposase [Terrilactibacillus sp. S3-3]